MAGEISTIQSLKAVDAWIDVINANINGGVRTAFKASRLKFAGSNTDVSRAGTTTSLPLQFPEPGLITANTVIDFSQGAITASTETTHLAIQGEGFFVLVDPGSLNADGTLKAPLSSTRSYITRDGEFRTNQNGLLVASNGYVLVTPALNGSNAYYYWSSTVNGAACKIRAVYNNIDNTANATVTTNAVRLTDFLANNLTAATVLAGGVTTLGAPGGGSQLPTSFIKMAGGKQNLQYSTFGSTIYDYGFRLDAAGDPSFDLTRFAYRPGMTSDATVLSKSLEASNASMTQSVPELSLAQKLFSALTKVLQTKQTNVDGVLNLIR
jgi:flagellar hook protein FlgE